MNLPLLLTRVDKLAQVLRSANLLRALLRYRVLAGAEHRQVLRLDLATVVDIGANRGQAWLTISSRASGITFWKNRKIGKNRGQYNYFLPLRWRDVPF